MGKYVSLETKQEAVRRLDAGEIATVVARDMKISVNSIYKWRSYGIKPSEKQISKKPTFAPLTLDIPDLPSRKSGRVFIVMGEPSDIAEILRGL